MFFLYIYTYSDGKQKRSLQKNIDNKTKALQTVRQQLRKLDKTRRSETQPVERNTAAVSTHEDHWTYASLNEVSMHSIPSTYIGTNHDNNNIIINFLLNLQEEANDTEGQ